MSERTHNEGFEIWNDKTGERDHLKEMFGTFFKKFDPKNMSFVRVYDLQYDTSCYDNDRYGFCFNGNKQGLKITIDPNGLVKEYIGLILHIDCEVNREGLQEFFERYGGGIDTINDQVEMIDRMNLYNFKYEVMDPKEILKRFPKISMVID
tara:strand:- start:207 stop:659 length:453 start_codon:yes stop_codon:yes gene_type:complete